MYFFLNYWSLHFFTDHGCLHHPHHVMFELLLLGRYRLFLDELLELIQIEKEFLVSERDGEYLHIITFLHQQAVYEKLSWMVVDVEVSERF